MPENSVATRSAPSKASARSSAASRASFICGVDSPVSVASFVTAEPWTSTQSQGMIDGCARKWALRFFSNSRRASARFRASSALWGDGGGDSAGSGGGRRRAIEMRSPGSSSSLETSCHCPSRRQSTGAARADTVT